MLQGVFAGAALVLGGSGQPRIGAALFLTGALCCVILQSIPSFRVETRGGIAAARHPDAEVSASPPFSSEWPHGLVHAGGRGGDLKFLRHA
jgi:hypothetical protein